MKLSIGPKIKAKAAVQPQAWQRHVEDWIAAFNTEIGFEGKFQSGFWVKPQERPRHVED